MKQLAILALLLILSACGYHFSGPNASLPGGGRALYIPLFVNQTAEPQLENRLSSIVSEVFARAGEISLVEAQERADAVLEGVISSYQSRALSYDKNDNISEYRATMVVAAKLRQVGDGRLLWQGTISWDGEYVAAADKALQEDLEQITIEEISRRLAEELYYRLLEDF
jgi:outer membrane lipopolysaccharide assembly protein LptE/RlpB